MNSWERSDSYIGCYGGACDDCCNLNYGERCADEYRNCVIGPNDLDLMRRLAAGGPAHAKYRRMIVVYVDITAPLYWWKEFDTYKVGTVANSCSTMHKIAAKEFTLEDFSCEHLLNMDSMDWSGKDIKCSATWPSGIVNLPEGDQVNTPFMPMDILELTIKSLNRCRKVYLETKDKKYWWQMIQLLPSSYNQKRTVMMNYEVLTHIWNDRRNHKLDEWAEHPLVITKLNIRSVGLTKDGLGVRGPIETNQEYFGFCDWIRTLPYSELITGEFKEVNTCEEKN